jgi:hypothetical protein
MDPLKGTSLTWLGDTKLGRDLTAIGLIVLVSVVIVLLLGGLRAFQMRGEAPAFVCNPGSTYTTKECQ